ncbi:hypothetical protein E3U26_11795 [Paracoccus ferrooxidans]|nr:hypothetical protein [Paracoccus sp. (in: a-proteobacteria)]WGR61343.1 hypothetical protein E3U26_11795 [Paracoccus ferrooxidans]
MIASGGWDGSWRGVLSVLAAYATRDRRCRTHPKLQGCSSVALRTVFSVSRRTHRRIDSDQPAEIRYPACMAALNCVRTSAAHGRVLSLDYIEKTCVQPGQPVVAIILLPLMPPYRTGLKMKFIEFSAPARQSSKGPRPLDLPAAAAMTAWPETQQTQ